jgi:hypothetical protein
MSQAISNQHPAVVLRSHYNHLRALLAVAMIAVVGLTAAVVIVADDDGGGNVSNAASSPAQSVQSSPGNTRYDGGPEEGTVGPSATSSPREATTGYNGGPEEGTRGLGH